MGKTTFEKILIRHLLRLYGSIPLYILDTGHKGDFDEFPGHIESDTAPGPIKSGIQVWRPSVNNIFQFNEWFWMILSSPGPCIWLVDEIASLVKRKGDDAPENHQRLMKQGRGKYKCGINGAQEMTPSPKSIVTQTVHAVRFRMGGIENGYDRRTSNLLIGREGDAAEPPKFSFDYARVDELMSPIRYSGHQSFF